MAMIAKYSLNGNANDLVGSNNGTATNVTRVDGKMNQGGSFDGSSSKISAGNIISTTDLTIGMIMKTSTSTSSAVYYTLLCKRDTFGASGIFVFGTIGGKLFFRDFNGSAFGFAPGNVSTGNVADGKQHYVVFTRTGSTGIYYIDGKQAGTNTAVSTITPNTQGITIGNDPADNTYYGGEIDEIEIYDHVLTPADIKNKYLYYNGFM